jgi:hypothetical protein
VPQAASKADRHTAEIQAAPVVQMKQDLNKRKLCIDIGDAAEKRGNTLASGRGRVKKSSPARNGLINRYTAE